MFHAIQILQDSGGQNELNLTKTSKGITKLHINMGFRKTWRKRRIGVTTQVAGDFCCSLYNLSLSVVEYVKEFN